MATAPAPSRIYTVSGLTNVIRETLENRFQAVWVKGEISGWKVHAASGNVYFKLVEGKLATIDCALYRLAASRVTFQPRDGMEVEAFGRLSVYPARGSYQLAVAELRPGGMGQLLIRYEELKKRLQAEGLFDEARKRPLPPYPRRIGLVTSHAGAAVRDLIKVLRERWRGIEIVIAPVKVQGIGASEEIAAAVERFGRYGKVDVLIVARGGGSIEDLWSFNEENVVRAIARSPMPVISGVGHESDVTLADLVADVRAATPSNAAQRAVRDRREVREHVVHLTRRAEGAVRRGLGNARHRLNGLLGRYRFRDRREVIHGQQQRLDDLRERLIENLGSRLTGSRSRLAAAVASYGLREFPRLLQLRHEAVNRLSHALAPAAARAADARRKRLAAAIDQLRALSPRGVLERGYCLARAADGSLVRVASDLAAGQLVNLEFGRGEADARIEVVRPGETS